MKQETPILESYKQGFSHLAELASQFSQSPGFKRAFCNTLDEQLGVQLALLEKHLNEQKQALAEEIEVMLALVTSKMQAIQVTERAVQATMEAYRQEREVFTTTEQDGDIRVG